MLGGCKKIVLKIGSNVLSNDEGVMDRESVRNIADQVCRLRRRDKQVIIVSSGAGICGAGAIKKWDRREDINYKQALCAIGQVELMIAYREYMGRHGVHVAQMLLTAEDFRENIRNLNIRNTLFTLVDEGVVPVINENDSVSVDEIKIGDNDMLAAYTAVLWNADLLALMSDVDGVYDKSPKLHEDAKLIPEVYGAADLLENIDSGGKSQFGTGGMVTKISAAEEANRYGIPVVLANGKKPDILRRLETGDENGTVFFRRGA
ncbi:MAG: glutamate 5-kinase [Clostridiales Family XIII bacterium]|nr:glutamate 5-kinase [Clostridiales Family XIII bacterium]